MIKVQTGGAVMPSSPDHKQTNLSLFDRSKLSLTGVSDVSGFDEALVSVTTADGELSIEGDGLHITLLSLEEGRVDLEGRINAMVYSDGRTGKRRSFWHFLERKGEDS